MSLSRIISSNREPKGIEEQVMCVHKIKGTCPERKCDGYGHIKYKKRSGRNNTTYTTNTCSSYFMD